jgi:uncharacterized membrane protein YcaP (DUF421 family)
MPKDKGIRAVDKIFSFDWENAFVPGGSLLEIIVRGTLMYLILFVLMRAVLKRQAGELNLSDLLVITLLADAAQNGMAGEYKSISEGLLLCGTIIFWSYAIDWLSFHVPLLEKLIIPPQLLLVKEGRIIQHNLHKSLITTDELKTRLREQGVQALQDVKAAYLEGNGQISIIENKK